MESRSTTNRTSRGNQDGLDHLIRIEDLEDENQEAEHPIPQEPIFYAKKPNKSLAKWFWLVNSRLFFPPLLLWDGLRAISHWLVGESISQSLILPAQEAYASLERSTTVELRSLVKKRAGDTRTLDRYSVVTPDNSELDTIEITHSDQAEKPVEEQKYTLCFMGNAQHYADCIDEEILDDEGLNRNLVLFNYKGVIGSTGKTGAKQAIADDLIEMGRAQVDRLLQKGVKPENITLKGRSLGGAAAILTAADCHDREIPVNVFAAHTFSSTTNFVISQIRTLFGSNGNETGLGIALSYLAYPFVRFGVALGKFAMNVGDAYHSIPDTHKTYVCIQPHRDDRRLYLGDQIILPYASLHTYGPIANKRYQQKIDIKEMIKRNNRSTTIMSQKLADKTNALATKKLNKLKIHKLRLETIWNAHNESLGTSRSAYKLNEHTFYSGRNVYQKFVNAAHKAHEQAQANQIKRQP